MRSDNLRLAYVQTPTSLQMRPLRICIFSSTSFGDTFGNHLWKELPQIAQTEKHKLDFSRRFCLGSFRNSCYVLVGTL